MPELPVLIEHEGVTVAEYHATSEVPAGDTPKPYLHPLRTPSGVVVTGFAPEDHTWHHGLGFAFPRVDDHNLWGGGTYLGPEQGYVVLADQGSIRHERWLPTDGIVHELTWLGHGGEELLREERTVDVRVEGPAVVIDHESVLHNLLDHEVALETPAQRGRPDGGYGGLWLRLAEDFAAERIVGDLGEVTESGAVSDTLVVHGRTAAGEPVTLGLSFRDAPGGRNWIYRFEPFSAIGWGIAYSHGMTIPVDGTLAVRHRLVVLDGHAPVDEVRALL